MAAKKTKNESDPKRWSQHVTQTSFALDLEKGAFTWDDPRRIAESLRDSAERSKARKTTPFRSAMSMLNFFINRAGSQLPEEQRATLEAAKDELRALYGRERKSGKSAGTQGPGS